MQQSWDSSHSAVYSEFRHLVDKNLFIHDECTEAKWIRTHAKDYFNPKIHETSTDFRTNIRKKQHKNALTSNIIQFFLKLTPGMLVEFRNDARSMFMLYFVRFIDKTTYSTSHLRDLYFEVPFLHSIELIPFYHSNDKTHRYDPDNAYDITKMDKKGYHERNNIYTSSILTIRPDHEPFECLQCCDYGNYVNEKTVMHAFEKLLFFNVEYYHGGKKYCYLEPKLMPLGSVFSTVIDYTDTDIHRDIKSFG